MSRLLGLEADCHALLEGGEITKAEQLLRDALCGLRDQLTTRHELTIAAAYRLARFYALQDRMREADEVFDWLSHEFSGQYGLWHARTLEHYQQVVELLQAASRAEDAEQTAYRIFEALRDNWDRKKPVTVVAAAAREAGQPEPSREIDQEVLDRLFSESLDPVWVGQQLRLASLWRRAGLRGVGHLLPLIAERCEKNANVLLPQALMARCHLLELQTWEENYEAAGREAKEARNMLVTLVSRSNQYAPQPRAAALARRVAFLHLDLGDANRCEKILAWTAGKLEDCIVTWADRPLGAGTLRLVYNASCLHVVTYLTQVGMDYQERSTWVEAGPWFERAYSVAARVLGSRADIPNALEEAIERRKFLEKDMLLLTSTPDLPPICSRGPLSRLCHPQIGTTSNPDIRIE